MEQGDDEAGRIILPSDPFWLLRVNVPHDGDQIPYHVRLLWHYQFGGPEPTAETLLPIDNSQADGVP